MGSIIAASATPFPLAKKEKKMKKKMKGEGSRFCSFSFLMMRGKFRDFNATVACEQLFFLIQEAEYYSDVGHSPVYI